MARTSLNRIPPGTGEVKGVAVPRLAHETRNSPDDSPKSRICWICVDHAYKILHLLLLDGDDDLCDRFSSASRDDCGAEGELLSRTRDAPTGKNP